MQGPCFNNLTPELHDAVAQHWQKFQDNADADISSQLSQQPPSFWQQLGKVWACSDFVASQCCHRPQWLIELLPALQSYEASHYSSALKQRLAAVETEAQLHQQLRLFRNQEMLRIIWRDITRQADLIETTADLSNLADTCIDEALTWLYNWACINWGTPYSKTTDSNPALQQRMIVIGMGKLGANELNLSSDIDLIFAFPEMGETRDGRRCFDNQTFFNRLGKKLIQALDNNTADGFVFRVDMRLRPYGRSGILVLPFAAMEEYYQDQGRDWERYAMIKARVVAGDQQAGAELQNTLRPFTYRKYLDYSAFDSLREMKAMINREVKRKNLSHNVKLGPGGIREVEFIAQAFQLIRGGRDTRLQQRELRHILPLLPETVGMPEKVVDELWLAYEFLRNSEHAIQAFEDRQTQELPMDKLGQQRLALAMDFEDWDSFLTTLDQHREHVEQHFADVIAPAEKHRETHQDSQWTELWRGDWEDQKTLDFLNQNDFEDTDKALKLIADLRQSRKVDSLQQIARERLDATMPTLLEAVSQQAKPSETLRRVLMLVESVLRRSAYFALLLENPEALNQLVRLCSASPWIAKQLAKQPILLDQLIDVQSLYNPPDKKTLEDELRQQLLRIPEEDTEQLMEALRHFKNAHVLRVAAAEITGVLPLMKVSDYLTYIAEVILQGALDIAWKLITEKHGTPQRQEGAPCDPDFIVIGYGKMGGIELSYGSDLDLVFIHDANPQLATDGAKPIDCQVFFTRLGKRIIHILNTATISGQLYEVDMRLRPSGSSGLLVSSLSAFNNYQLNDAWTWEHQALVRARMVAGCSKLKQRWEQVRKNVLCQTIDKVALRQEVISMRQKMRDHLGTKPKPSATAKQGATAQQSATENETASVFNLKQDAGGIVDIEFLVQYLALAHAADKPELITFTDNIRILDAIEKTGLLPPEDAELLREAYKSYRSVGHRLSMQEQSNVISAQELQGLRKAVATIWDKVMGEALA